MKSIHQFFARVFSGQFKKPKKNFTNTDSVRLNVYYNMYEQLAQMTLVQNLVHMLVGGRITLLSNQIFQIQDKIHQEIN